VVGVVGDVRPAFESPQHAPSAYLPIRQSEDVFRWFSGLHVVVRGGDRDGMPANLRAIVLSLDKDMPPFNVRTLEDELSRLVARPRFGALALSAFAAVALTLAAVGVYGVMACTAAQRTREIGVRLALGATPAQLLRTVMRDGVIVVVGGLAGGGLAALWLTRTLTGLLFQVHPADPWALSAVALLLAAVGALAAYLPARRALRADAVASLRHE
jgi:putative ABC transport system permease protein